MSSLFTSGQLAQLSGDYGNVFDSFSKTITIYKEPQKLLNPQVANGLYGFGANQSVAAYTYTPVTGVFQARVKYAEEDAILLEQTNTYLPVNPVTIRVRNDAKNFFDNGVNEKVLVDGRSYKIDGEFTKNSFLNLDYYTYKLRAIQ